MSQIRLSFVLLMLSLMITGCQKRSISNSGYNEYGRNYGYNATNRELSEFDVLGVDQKTQYTPQQIQDAFNNKPITHWLIKGDPLLLVQSGAQIPDSQMSAKLKTYFNVQEFTGVIEEPDHDRRDESETLTVIRLLLEAGKDVPEGFGQTNPEPKPSYSTSIRMAAAKASINTIMVYWGIIESGVKNHETKAVSWIPIAGMILPDETQYMRIRLKVALIDVKTGQWQMFTPDAFDNESLSASLNRGSSDQQQVEKLKTLAYANTVNYLLKRYTQ